jgi:putative addiction module CopG family antidote
MLQVKLKPEIEQFVEEQVTAGHYSSVDAMIEAALLEMRDAYELDDETIAAINEGSEQAESGEGMEFDEFRAFMEKRLTLRD